MRERAPHLRTVLSEADSGVFFPYVSRLFLCTRCVVPAGALPQQQHVFWFEI